MRHCRVCNRKYLINTKHAGCCSLNCYKIRRKQLSSKNIFYHKKTQVLAIFMKEQLERALKK